MLKIIGEVPKGLNTEELAAKLAEPSLNRKGEPFHTSGTLWMDGKNYNINYSNPEFTLKFTLIGESPADWFDPEIRVWRIGGANRHNR